MGRGRAPSGTLLLPLVVTIYPFTWTPQELLAWPFLRLALDELESKDDIRENAPSSVEI